MNLKLAVIFSALISLGLVAAPSTSDAQVRDLLERARRGDKKEAAPPPAQPKAQDTRSLIKKARSKGKGKAYAKGHDKK